KTNSSSCLTLYVLGRMLTGEKMAAMYRWCNKEGVMTTPTFFVNGHRLPEMYSVADLKYFLSV
ncbi:DsbA family protein, partial [Arachidicoccus sp.]|uniref:DsbA family protein n=1 Tax=Arachidicoccus sp. TaxID=1872624 RepID=UPI003D1E3799